MSRVPTFPCTAVAAAAAVVVVAVEGLEPNSCPAHRSLGLDTAMDGHIDFLELEMPQMGIADNAAIDPKTLERTRFRSRTSLVEVVKRLDRPVLIVEPEPALTWGILDKLREVVRCTLSRIDEVVDTCRSICRSRCVSVGVRQFQLEVQGGPRFKISGARAQKTSYRAQVSELTTSMSTVM